MGKNTESVHYNGFAALRAHPESSKFYGLSYPLFTGAGFIGAVVALVAAPCPRKPWLGQAHCLGTAGGFRGRAAVAGLAKLTATQP